MFWNSFLNSDGNTKVTRYMYNFLLYVDCRYGVDTNQNLIVHHKIFHYP